MQYPIEILPRRDFKNDIDINNLLNECPESYLIRIASLPTLSDPNNIKSREICAATQDFVNMSSNLLGKFKLEYLIFKPVNRPKQDDWLKSDGTITPSDIQYQEVNNYPPIFIKLSLLHNRSLPTVKHINKGTQSIDFSISVFHRPKKPNYWHLELFITDELGNELDRSKLPPYVNRGIKTFLEFDIQQKVSGIAPNIFDVITDEHFIE
jgi:hypothetical protein